MSPLKILVQQNINQILDKYFEILYIYDHICYVYLLQKNEMNRFREKPQRLCGKIENEKKKKSNIKTTMREFCYCSERSMYFESHPA